MPMQKEVIKTSRTIFKYRLKEEDLQWTVEIKFHVQFPMIPPEHFVDY